MNERVVIQMGAPRGRPSLGRLAELAERADDYQAEVLALTAEHAEVAARLVALARQAQVRLAKGLTPADLLDEIERLALRHGVQATAAAAAMRVDEVCPDGVEQRRSGHGAAA